MKKLVTLAAAALCGAAFAGEGIQSANIVGYQNKTLKAFNPVTSTMVPVADSANEVWTFADYKVNCNETDLSAKSGWKTNTDTFNTYTAVGLFDKSYVYVSEALATALTSAFGRTVVKGWYASTHTAFETPCNDKQIPVGQGVIAKTVYSDAAITFAGGVKNAPTVTDIGTFTVTGNSSPVEIKIGDLIVNCNETDISAKNGWKANTDTVNVYTDNGLFKAAYVYVPQVLADALSGAFGRTVQKGWYASTDSSFTTCCNDTVKFAAGEGFVAKAVYSDATLTVKSALAK